MDNIKPDSVNEKERQQEFPWSRSKYHVCYNEYLAHYKIKSCLEQAAGSSLLDLACGDGMLTELAAGQFERVVGVDASSDHLVKARERLPNATFHDCLIEDLETDEKFGTVLLLDILEHLQDPVLVLKKAASFLEPGGRLIAHVPNAHGINRKLAVLMGTLESCEELSPFDIEIAGHRRYYTTATLLQDFVQAELKVVANGGIFLKMLSTAQMDWFLENGLWDEGGFGWGRVGGPDKNWRDEFCRASYELGKERPEDCNIIYACAERAQ